MKSKRFASIVPYVVLAAAGAGTLRADLINNVGWTVVSQPGSDPTASWYSQSGTLSPVNSLPVPAPPQGDFAAMSDQDGPGTTALIQSFTVPSDSQVTLSFDIFVDNQNFDINGNPVFYNPDSLDFNVFPNQQARVDILTADAGAFDLGGAVADNVFNALSNTTDYLSETVDITSAVGGAGGGTFQLRFATVDTFAPFVVGVDGVSIIATQPTPEPASWILLAAGVIGLSAWRWRNRLVGAAGQRRRSAVDA